MTASEESRRVLGRSSRRRLLVVRSSCPHSFERSRDARHECPALWHEITASAIRPVFLQEPLDRTRACLVRADVDVANALCMRELSPARAGNSRHDPTRNDRGLAALALARASRRIRCEGYIVTMEDHSEPL